MKNKAFLASLAAILSILASSCIIAVGNYSRETDSYSDSPEPYGKPKHAKKADLQKVKVKEGGFSRISVQEGIKVEFQSGAYPDISVVSSPELKKYVDVKVTNGTLVCKYKKNRPRIAKSIPTVVRAISPQLDEVVVSSGASFDASELNMDRYFRLSSSSGGVVNISAISCSNLTVHLSSGSDVEVKKIQGNVSVAASSGASFRSVTVKGLEAAFKCNSGAAVSLKEGRIANVGAEASSSSKILLEDLEVQNIKANASSGAKIKLSGTCGHIRQKVSSGGKVNVNKLRELGS